MSLKLMSLGSATAAARGIVMSATSTSNPAGVTLTAGHRQRNDARVAIVGCQASTKINGEWSLSNVAATSANLVGCDTSGAVATLSGTPIMAAICDRTPFLPNHSAVAYAGVWGAATTSGAAATCTFEGADSAIFEASTAAGNKFQYNAAASPFALTDGFRAVLLGGEIALPAGGLFGDGAIMVEVKLARYMALNVSSWTSGTFVGGLLA